MRSMKKEQCSTCEHLAIVTRGNYEFGEMGLPVVLQRIQIVKCSHCGTTEPIIPNLNDLMHTVALAVICKPCTLDGEEIKFLRRYVGKTATEFSTLLHLDNTSLSKMENEERKAGPRTDKLIRFLTVSLSPELIDKMDRLVKQLPTMRDCEKKNAEIQIDPQTMQCQYA